MDQCAGHWGAAIRLARAAAGVIGCEGGMLRVHSASTGPGRRMDVVRLRNYRLAPRKARIELIDGTARLHLPQYFGRRPWSLPVGDMAVADLTSSSSCSTAVEEPEPLFARPIRIPYLFTTGPATEPNLIVLFGEPKRVPPLRWSAAIAPNTDLPFGFFESRAQGGASVDGVMLRTADPVAAVAKLVAAGVEPFSDGLCWLASRRRIVTDPTERAALLQRRHRVGRLQRMANWAGWATLGVGLAGGALGIDVGWVAAAALLIGGMHFSLRFLARRHLRTDRDSGKEHPFTGGSAP